MAHTHYMQDRLERSLGLKPPPEKKKQEPLKGVSDKKKAEKAQEKEDRAGEDTFMEKFYQNRRREMTGICICGCGQPSQKKDDLWFRSSICHLFPKRIFQSIMYHKDNWLELRFWGGCHTNFDERGMDKWPNTACWETIKEKFYVLAPLLTDQEMATKFYKQLESLVYAK